MLPTLGARSFYAAAPCLWNSLPAEFRDIQSLYDFKRNLKTHLFRAGLNLFFLIYVLIYFITGN